MNQVAPVVVCTFKWCNILSGTILMHGWQCMINVMEGVAIRLHHSCHIVFCHHQMYDPHISIVYIPQSACRLVSYPRSELKNYHTNDLPTIIGPNYRNGRACMNEYKQFRQFESQCTHPIAPQSLPIPQTLVRKPQSDVTCKISDVASDLLI